MERLTDSLDWFTHGWHAFVGSNDIVGIKITAEPGLLLASHRPLVEAIVTSLRNAGIPAAKIHVFDRDPTKLRDAGFDGLAKPIIGGAGWDVENFYEQNLVGKLIWGDLLFRQADDDLSRSRNSTGTPRPRLRAHPDAQSRPSC